MILRFSSRGNKGHCHYARVRNSLCEVRMPRPLIQVLYGHCILTLFQNTPLDRQSDDSDRAVLGMKCFPDDWGGGVIPSTQLYYRRLILLLNTTYTATCFGRTTILRQK
jgi:hypothetical protein